MWDAPKWRVSRENPIKMDEMGYPHFRKPPYIYIYTCIHCVQFANSDGFPQTSWTYMQHWELKWGALMNMIIVYSTMDSGYLIFRQTRMNNVENHRGNRFLFDNYRKFESPIVMNSSEMP